MVKSYEAGAQALLLLFLVPAYGAFAADLFTQEQGKRIFPLIGVGSSLGAWLGSVWVGNLVEEHGPFRLLVGAGCILVGCVLVARVASRVVDRRASRAVTAADKPLGKEGGFEMIRKDLVGAWLAVVALLNGMLPSENPVAKAPAAAAE